MKEERKHIYMLILRTARSSFTLFHQCPAVLFGQPGRIDSRSVTIFHNKTAQRYHDIPGASYKRARVNVFHHLVPCRN